MICRFTGGTQKVSEVTTLMTSGVLDRDNSEFKKERLQPTWGTGCVQMNMTARRGGRGQNKK